jgi:hypothetical protein
MHDEFHCWCLTINKGTGNTAARAQYINVWSRGKIKIYAFTPLISGLYAKNYL